MKKTAKAVKKRAARAARNRVKEPLVKDLEYLQFIRLQPCMCCHILSEKQSSPTEAAHIGEVRGLRQKAPDSTAVPLCRQHHTQGPLAHHKLGKFFFPTWRIDREETIRKYQRLYAVHVRKQKEVNGK